MKLRTVVAALFVGSAVAVSGAAAAAPSLRLLDRDPVTIAGARFERGERVRVTLAREASSKKVVRAGRRGTFVVTFQGATATRCDLVRIIAVGVEGSRALLKILPSPACKSD